MDIDRDGKADTLYRQAGGDNHLLMGIGDTEMHKDFRKQMFERGQVFYHKGKPYFVLSDSLTGLSLLEPFSARNFLDFGFHSVCQYTTHFP